MVVFGIGAGLRPGELVTLRGGDVARRGRQVTVRVAGRRRGWCRSPRVMPAARASWPAARAAGSCSGPARLSAAIRTSSPTSPGAWPLTRPRPPCRCAGPGPASSAATWPRAPRCRRAAGHHRDRRGRVAGPLRPSRRRHQLLQGRPAGPLPRGAHAMSSGGGLTLPATGGGQRRDGRLRRRADRPLRQGPGHRGRAGPRAPGGAARCRCALCSPRCCAWPWMTGRCS